MPLDPNSASGLTAEGPTEPAARTLRLTLEYDGARFAGWQVQPDARTVQGELERALAELLRAPVRVAGASRTDAGVHALGQVASFETRATVTPERLQAGLNALLPDDVAVVAVDEAPPGFHARFWATGKHYRYRLLLGRARRPLEAQAAWHVPWALDLAAMQAAGARLVGTHDFASFASRPDGDRDCTRTLFAVDVSRAPTPAAEGARAAPDVVHVDVRGDGFLYKMVRTIVGTLCQVGRGRLAPEGMDAVLAARRRRAAGPTAPAHGLFLVRVEHDVARDAALAARFLEGVAGEGQHHGSAHERARDDQDVRAGEGPAARALLRAAPLGRDRVLDGG